MELSDEDKEFFIKNKELIINNKWNSLMKNFNIYYEKSNTNGWAILNILKENGVDYLKYPPFRIGDKIKVIPDAPFCYALGPDNFSELMPYFPRKWDWERDNFIEINARDIKGVVEDIININNEFSSYMFPFASVIKIIDGEYKGKRILINQENIRDLT